MTDRPRIRPTARVLVLDPAGRVLLFGARLVDLATPPGDVLYWYTPGGEIEADETVRQAAARELAEEIGLAVEPGGLQGPVALRRAVGLLLGELVDARETYFLLRDVVHDVDVSGQTELEAYEDQPHRWWTVEEIRAADQTFVPPELADVVAELLDGPFSGPPRVLS